MTAHTPWCPFDGCPVCAAENARLIEAATNDNKESK